MVGHSASSIPPGKRAERNEFLATALWVSIVIALFAVVTQFLDATSATSLSATQQLMVWLVAWGLIVLLWIAYMFCRAYVTARPEQAEAEQARVAAAKANARLAEALAAKAVAEQVAKAAQEQIAQARPDADQQRARVEQADAEQARVAAAEANAQLDEALAAKAVAEQEAKAAQEQIARARQDAEQQKLRIEQARDEARKAERRLEEALKGLDEAPKGGYSPQKDSESTW